MKCVVTGGAGFIGSHLASELVKRGHQVTILDDLSTGTMRNIERLLTGAHRPDDVQFVQGSVTDLTLVRLVCSGVDYVFHLAAIASVPRSVLDPLSSHNVNLTGTVNVLQAAVERRVRKVVYFSSSAVYGDSGASVQHEEMAPSPQSPYAVAKLAGEYYCKVFREIYGLDTVCLRYFNVYGPGQDPSSQYAAVIPRFVDLIEQGEAPTIFGDGEQTRDFVFVADAVAAAVLAAESSAKGVFNVGSGKAITINEVCGHIVRLAGKNVLPVFAPARAGDIVYSKADITRARGFGYAPKYSIEAGLEETVRQRAPLE